MSALTKTGERQLAEAEAIIEAGLDTFMAVGAALTAIREGKLYRAEHDTFDNYCLDRWRMTSRRANQLMDAAAIGTMVPIANERQARALASLASDPDALKAAYKQAEAEGPVTAASLARAANPSPNVNPETGEIKSSGEGMPSATGSGAGEDVAPGQTRETSSPSPVPSVDPVLGYRARATAERSKVRSGLLTLDAQRVMETTDDPQAWISFASDLLDFISDLKAQPTTLRAVN